MSPAWRFYLGLYAGSRRAIALSTALTLTQVTLTLPIALLLRRLPAAYPRAVILVISHDSDVLNAADYLYTLKAGTIFPSVPVGPLALCVAR
jgi:hypothetical protein